MKSLIGTVPYFGTHWIIAHLVAWSAITTMAAMIIHKMKRRV